MKDLVIGMGEALWDVLPDGKKNRRAPCQLRVSRFTVRASEPRYKCYRR